MRRHEVPLLPLTAAGFAPFGEVLAAREDGPGVTLAEQALDLSGGQPRFWVMRLGPRGSSFTRITRHQSVTQVLAAVGGGAWWLGVAAPGTAPAPEDIVGFEVPGDAAVLLRRGTWHAGPFFDGEEKSFFNLELADTNEVDHVTVALDERDGVDLAFAR